MIGFSSVSKRFGNITALEDISFDIDEGEFVFITGASGAGKSTILKLILSEILPDEGTISFDNKDVTSLKSGEIPLHRQQIGVVFQDFKLLSDRTVWENVEIALAVRDLPKEECDDRIQKVLELAGLDKRAHLFPAQLSGGEAQRTSLARALVGNPKVLLADEPTGNLDLKTSFDIMELLEQVSQEGKTVIMATHDIVIVEKLKKRTIELDQGKLKKDTKHKR